MTHPGTGNSTWQDWPSTATLITAERLEAIESALDRATPGPWLPLTMQNGWQGRDVAQGTASFYAPSCRLLPGGTVELVGTIYRTTGATNGLTIAVLPPGHRPDRETAVIGMDSAAYSINIGVKPNGSIDVATYRTTATTLTLTGRFAIDGPT